MTLPRQELEAPMDYLNLLNHSYEMSQQEGCPLQGRLEFLSESVFDFTTYDGEMAALFAKHAIAVFEAINARRTFDFILYAENYKWFLIMCNMPFFADKIEWGTSIRGARWKPGPITVESWCFWFGDEPIILPTLNDREWQRFAAALLTFASEDQDGQMTDDES